MIFALLTLLSGLSISVVAAYYSIIGLTTIFSGSAMAVAIMGAVLEVGKLVTASWLKQNWAHAGFLLKSYLTIAVIVLMFITSMGIFGYLSKAHLQQTSGINYNGSKVEKINFDISVQENNIKRSQAILDRLDAAIDAYIEKEYITRGLRERKEQEPERQELHSSIEQATKKIDELTEKKFILQQEVQEIEVEVGPLKYIADFAYGEEKAKDMLDEAVRAVILILIFVFDPLAVLLLLASNISFIEAAKKRKQKKEQKKKEEASTKLIDFAEKLEEPKTSILASKSEQQVSEKEVIKKPNVLDTYLEPVEEIKPEELPTEEENIFEDPKKEIEEKTDLHNWQDKLLEPTEKLIEQLKLEKGVSVLTKDDMLLAVEHAFEQAIAKANIPFNLNSPEGEELKKIIIKSLQKEYKEVDSS